MAVSDPERNVNGRGLGTSQDVRKQGARGDCPLGPPGGLL